MREQPRRSRSSHSLPVNSVGGPPSFQARGQAGGRSSSNLNPGDCLQVVCRDGQMVMSLNGTELEVACKGVPAHCYGVIDLYGPVEQVCMCVFACMSNSCVVC